MSDSKVGEEEADGHDGDVAVKLGLAEREDGHQLGLRYRRHLRERGPVQPERVGVLA